jgi:hypothetical protein
MLISYRLLAATVATLALSGCQTREPHSVYSDHSGGLAYEQTRTDSLFASDQAVISNDAIARIFESKVAIGENIKLAVLPIGWNATHSGYAASIQEGIASALSETKRVSMVTRIPGILLPEKRLELPWIREACARLQCDHVLIYTISQDIRVNTKLFGKDRAKTYSTIEAVLLDVRSGLVPWTDLVDDEVKTLQKVGDVTVYEQARNESMENVTVRMANDLAGFYAAAK